MLGFTHMLCRERVDGSLRGIMLMGIECKEKYTMTGTVVYLESIPPPSRITVGGKETSSNPRRLVEVQMALNASQDENRRIYDLQNPMSHDYQEGSGIGVTSELEGSWEEDSPSELDFSAGKEESFIVDILKEEVYW